MPTVARVGDLSDHGGYILPTGQPTSVDTNGRPPAVLGALHSCPIRGHGITALVPTEATVEINGLPRIRLGDKAGCGATIIAASPNVFIGGPNPEHVPVEYEAAGEFDAIAGIAGEPSGGTTIIYPVGTLGASAGAFTRANLQVGVAGEADSAASLRGNGAALQHYVSGRIGAVAGITIGLVRYFTIGVSAIGGSDPIGR